MESQCKEMYFEKIKVLNMISSRTEDEVMTMELVERPESFLEDLNFYFPDFLFYLWSKPKIMAMLLKNTDLNEVKNHFAPLVVNNFYENIISPNFIEENLIYILTLLLEEEINNLSSVNEYVNFLDNTRCGYLLEELRRKKDVQTFFKTIILDALENLETNYSNLKLNFNPDDMNSSYMESLKSKNSNFKIKNMDIYLNPSEAAEGIEGINYRDRNLIAKEQVTFNKKYIPPFDKESVEKFVEEYKIGTTNNMYDLHLSLLNNLASDQFLYSDQTLLMNLNKFKISDKLLYIYQNNFMRVIDFINLILEKIIKSFHLFPYSLKCFCKIISMLVKRKFPNLTNSQRIIFISKFFFGKVLIPILRNPDVEAFINNIIISENTFNNLQIICDIINKFISGEFYTSDDPKNYGFTPFNWFFVEKSGQLYKIIRQASKVRLPSFIEKFINNKLPSNFEYDYFEQNKDEVINFRSICLNIHEANILIKAVDKCKAKIFELPDSQKFKISFEKLMMKRSQNIINNIINKEGSVVNDIDKFDTAKTMNLRRKSSVTLDKLDKIEIPPKKKKKFYFLFMSLLTNNDYKKLFEITQPTKSFSIKELKDLSTEENVTKNNIIKVKNFICNLLYNFDKLVKTNFEPGTIENTEKILEELNILMQSSYFVMDGSIPFDWYINSIFEYLQKIPPNLTKNDCEELYKEIEKDINDSISKLDFIKLSVILEKLEFAERGKIFYKENQMFLNDINLNEEIKEIIQKEFIPVKMKFNWNEENNGIFEIESINFKEKDRDNLEKIKSFEKSKKVILALTIEQFTKKFPNLLVYQELQDLDIFKMQEKLNFPDNIGKYFEIVFNHLEMNPNLKKHSIKLDKIKENIFDYIMGKLYDKIFPLEPNSVDNKIFYQTVKLSWTKPKHFLGEKKQYVFGSFIKDVKRFFRQLILEKSPRKKLLNVHEISNDVSFFYSFNGDKEIGLEDEISILSYAMIKVQPIVLDSNLKFMKLYCKVGGIIQEGNKLEQLTAVIDFIINLKYNNLWGVTQEEFSKECKKIQK